MRVTAGTARRLIVGALLVMVVSVAQASAPARRQRMRNAFYAMDTCTSAVYGASSLTAEQQLDLVKELGYRGLSWTVGEPDALSALCRGAAARGLKVYALYAGASLGRERLDYDLRLIAAMNVLKGSDTLIWLHVGSADFAHSSPEGDAVAVAGLRQLADYAAERGLRVALYPHVGEWVERVQDAIRIARQVGRKNLGVTFNLCHCLQVGDEAQIPSLLADARPHLFSVTVNGADAGAPGAPWNRLIQTLDRGTYDLAPLLARLGALRYTGPIGLQGYGIGGDPRDNLTRSMAAWRRLAGGAAPGEEKR